MGDVTVDGHDITSTLLSTPLNTTVYIFVIALIIGYYMFVRNRDLPPGPPKLPVIGNLWWVLLQRLRGKRLAVAVKEYCDKTTSDVLHLTFFNTNIVFFNGYDTIHEAFVKRADDFSHRPQWLIERTRPDYGVVFSNGHEWKSMRRFTLLALKDFGVGKSSLEEKIMLEVESATDVFLQNKGEPTSYRHLTFVMIINIIYGICFGTRLDHDSDAMKTVIERLEVLFGPESLLDPTSMLPRIIWKILGNKQRYDAMDKQKAVFEWIYKHIDEHIEDHRATLDDNNPRDFIDLFLIHEKTNTDDSQSFTRKALYGSIVDLFVAGSETTSNSLNWAILYLQEFPEIQKRCQEEINEKLGSRSITYADRGSLPYTEATLMEIQRMSNIAEISVSHTNVKEAIFHGYRIPANSLIHGLLISSNMDLKYWDAPDIFNPERHLKDGKVVKNPAYMPFSVGPRMCLGDMLAKMEMFVIFTNLLQRFNFEKEQLGLRHSLQSIVEQLTTSPLPYKTRMIKRDT